MHSAHAHQRTHWKTQPHCHSAVVSPIWQKKLHRKSCEKEKRVRTKWQRHDSNIDQFVFRNIKPILEHHRLTGSLAQAINKLGNKLTHIFLCLNYSNEHKQYIELHLLDEIYSRQLLSASIIVITIHVETNESLLVLPLWSLHLRRHIYIWLVIWRMVLIAALCKWLTNDMQEFPLPRDWINFIRNINARHEMSLETANSKKLNNVIPRPKAYGAFHRTKIVLACSIEQTTSATNMPLSN